MNIPMEIAWLASGLRHAIAAEKAKAMSNIVERLRRRSLYLDGSSAERTMDEAADKIDRLTAAIRWALGEAPNADGKWFDDAKPHPYPKYWWRTELRRALEDKP